MRVRSGGRFLVAWTPGINSAVAVSVAALLAIALNTLPVSGQRASRPSRPAPAPTTPLISAAPAQTGATAIRSPRNANYSIDVELDPASRTITGREVVTWRNITAHATSELRFHLYWNAWRNDRSTWLKETARASRGAPSEEHEP